MVSPFPPLRDGVGKYAAQEVRALRDQGHEVEVLAPVACAAHRVENLKGGLRLLALRRHAGRFDRIVLQYQPSHYHTHGSGLRRLVSNAGMALTFALVRNMTVVCHEVEYPPSHWRKWRPELVAERLAWTMASEVAFHTQREAEAMRDRLGARPRRVALRRHGEFFRPSVTEDRGVARRRLGLPADGVVFLCIGFVQRHKGFDRAARALRSVPGADVRLYVVGSVRDDSPEHQTYVAALRALAAEDTRVEVRIEAPSDEEFDRWIVASDVVVLPYRGDFWSSGVIERAKLLGRPVIATDAGGIREQTGAKDTVVTSDRELALAMARAAGHDHVEAPSADAFPRTPVEAAEYVRAEADRRRGRSLQTPTRRPRSSLLTRLENARGVHPVILPSARPVVGRGLTLAKRYLRRAMGWYIVPMLGQINEFEDRTYEAVEELFKRGEGLREEISTAVSVVERRMDTEAAENAKRLDELRAVILDDLSSRFDRLREGIDDAVKRLDQVERRTRGLTELMERRAPDSDAPMPPEGPAAASTSDPAAYTAIDYHRFESRYRGDPEIIKREQRDRYLADFRDRGPVVDVGCGRGEFLEVLAAAGVEARGVDIDLDMVMDCRGKGLDVEHADGIAYLQAVEPASVGGIIAAQVVEHLPPRGIVSLLAAARRALRPGGILVCETINPASLYALANWYTMDLTHAQPVHPNTLTFLAEQEGFSRTEVRYLSPVREGAAGVEVSEDTPDWARALVSSVSSELERLDQVVFGPQDYALVAFV